MHPRQIERLRPYARVIKNNTKTNVYCDIMLINRIIDKEPDNIIAKKKIQMVHTCNYLPTLHVPQGRHATICVSEIVKSSFQKETEESIVIKNIVPKIVPKRVLLLVTASRFDTTEKGQKRMDKLASAMDEKGIPYIWLYFSNVELKNAPKNLIRMQPTLDIANYMAMADYLVQLSDVEAFGYSIAEALNLGVPVLTTPIDVLPELGFVDGVTGYILPFDMKDIDIEKIYNSRLKGFKYKYDNDKIVNQWKEILGNPKPCRERQIDEPLVRVKAIITYYDIALGRKVFKNDELEMKSKRAYELLQKNFVVLV
jgi:glycosyltransferase involved in cell wall biosynthesis